MPLGTYDVLVQLSLGGGKLRLKDLLTRVILSQPGLSRRVGRLEEAGLVERRPDPKDGRGVIVAITRAGRYALRSAAVVHMAGINRELTADLTDEEAEGADPGVRPGGADGGDRAVTQPALRGTHTAAGYLSVPAGAGPWPGVVVLHELFGMTDDLSGRPTGWPRTVISQWLPPSSTSSDSAACGARCATRPAAPGRAGTASKRPGRALLDHPTARGRSA